MRTTVILLLFASGCATSSLTEGGRRVQIVTNTPAGCKYVSEVVGKVDPYFMRNQDARDASRVKLKNSAAKLGINTLVISDATVGTVRAEGYRCEK